MIPAHPIRGALQAERPFVDKVLDANQFFRGFPIHREYCRSASGWYLTLIVWPGCCPQEIDAVILELNTRLNIQESTVLMVHPTWLLEKANDRCTHRNARAA